jgi:hypothetical protein
MASHGRSIYIGPETCRQQETIPDTWTQDNIKIDAGQTLTMNSYEQGDEHPGLEPYHRQSEQSPPSKAPN